ncbi:MAG: hypothetical protein Kow00120_18090 [Anaerolineae bacterium]
MRKLLVTLFVVALISVTLGVNVASADFVHVVQPGERLYSIGRLYNISPAAIAAANGLANWNLIYPGQHLVIPSSAPPYPGGPYYPPGGSVYIVRYGDTLSRIAQMFGVSTAALAAANGIYNWNYIYVGQRLVIPGGYYPYPGPYPSPGCRYTYTVRTGDTLYSIARAFGSSPAAIAAANGIYNWSYIQITQVLCIP